MDRGRVAGFGGAAMNRLHNGGLLLARLVLGGTFLYASLDKIADPAAFAEAIANYHLLPPSTQGFVAAILPWVEALAGGLLLIGLMTAGASLVVAALSATFALAITSALWRGLDVSCGCFTLQPGAATAGWGHVGLDLALLAVASLVLWRGPGLWALEGLPRCGEEARL